MMKIAKTTVFADFALKVVKLTNSFHPRVRIQGGNINFCPENRCFETTVLLKTAVFDPKSAVLAKRKTTCLEKVTPVFNLVLT